MARETEFVLSWTAPNKNQNRCLASSTMAPRRLHLGHHDSSLVIVTTVSGVQQKGFYVSMSTRRWKQIVVIDRATASATALYAGEWTCILGERAPRNKRDMESIASSVIEYTPSTTQDLKKAGRQEKVQPQIMCLNIIGVFSHEKSAMFLVSARATSFGESSSWKVEYRGQKMRHPDSTG